eukprot:scaffold13359_cov85-Skeletonema_dohrnii-CCMP3373.AAC.1
MDDNQKGAFSRQFELSSGVAMVEVSPSPPAAAATLTKGDSYSDLLLSHTKITAPTPSPFPPPKNKKKYTKLEVLTLSMTHGKKCTIDAITESKYGPSRATLFKMFPKKDEEYDEVTIKSLLSNDKIGSIEWYNKIDAISRDVQGPTQSTIYSMFGVEGREKSTSTESFEKDAPQRSSTNANAAVEHLDRTPLAPISPNKIQTRQSARKRKNLEQDLPPQIEDAETVQVDDIAQGITERLQSESDVIKEINPEDVVKIVQSAIQSAIAARENREGVISINGVDSAGRTTTQYLLPLKKPRPRKASSSDRSTRKLVHERAKQLDILYDFIMHEDDDQEIKDEVMSIFAEKHGFFYAKEEDLLLDMAAVATMRDIVGAGNGGTNLMCRMKSVLEKFVPPIRGKILPSCLKHKLGLFDAADNDPIRTRMQSVVVSKDETKSRLANHSCLLQPSRLLERIFRKEYIEDALERSEDFMSDDYPNKCVVSFNTDKSSTDLVTTIKVLNKKGGNSANDTYPVAFTNGPLAECYSNLKATHYNPSDPTKLFLQHIVDDRLFLLAVTIGKSQCQCFVFLPTPAPNEWCANRFIGVDVLSDTKVESSVEFDEELATSLSPPEVVIPLEETNVSIRAVLSNKSNNVVIGVEIVVGGEVKYTHKLRAPMTTEANCPLSARLLQIQGHPPNDMKMGANLNGTCSNTAICPCLACVAEKSTWKRQRSAIVWNYMQKKGLIEDGEECPTDPPLREGNMSTAKCWEVWNESTVGGTVLLSKSQDRSLKIKCASVTHEPLLFIHPDKLLLSDPMHVSSGVGNRALEEMRKEVRRIEDGEDFMQIVRSTSGEVEKAMKQLDLLGGDKDVPSLLAPLHKESCSLRRRVSKAMDNLAALETKADEEDDDETRTKLEKSIEMLNEEYAQLFDRYKQHASDSKYSHLCQLQIGMTEFGCALKKFMNKSSKRPRGKL